MLKSKLGKYIKIQHGFAFKSENYVSKSQYALVTLANISESNTFKYSETKTTYYGADFPKNVILVKGDLVLPLTEQVVGLLGNSALIPFIQNIKFVLNQRVGRIRLLNNEMDKYYLHYLLSTNLVKKQLEARACGTKQRNISPEDVYDVTVFLPSYNIQQKIGNFLYLIEQKIELNNKINAALENVAKDLYNYWFVQFDFPDGNGRPYKSSGGKMVYNKVLKREMPEGWEIKNLAENSLTTILKPGIDKFENEKVYLPTAAIDGDRIIDRNNLITYENREGRANMQPISNSVWFAKMKKTKKILYFGEYSKNNLDNLIISTGMLGLECKNNSLEYIWNFINDSNFEAQKDKLSHGATQEGVNNDDLFYLPILIPSSEILDKFSKRVKSLYQQKYTNEQENKRLAELRDFLLPMLMNSQVLVG